MWSEWFGTLFMTTVALDTAARVWDCYLRDGEMFVWRTALEILRLLQVPLHPSLSLARLPVGASAPGSL